MASLRNKSITLNKKTYTLDTFGFLIDPNKWSVDFAHFVIQGWNLEMGVTEKHLQIIFFLRQYFAATQNIPTIFETCEANSIGLKKIHKLSISRGVSAWCL